MPTIVFDLPSHVCLLAVAEMMKWMRPLRLFSKLFDANYSAINCSEISTSKRRNLISTLLFIPLLTHIIFIFAISSSTQRPICSKAIQSSSRARRYSSRAFLRRAFPRAAEYTTDGGLSISAGKSSNGFGPPFDLDNAA